MANPAPASPGFVSVVLVVRNQAGELGDAIAALAAALSALAPDYEIVVVDNASTDGTVEALTRLTGDAGLPNLQVYALSAEVEADHAIWLGLDAALGDFVVVFDLGQDAPEALAPLIVSATSGADIVFAHAPSGPPEALVHRLLASVFDWLYWGFHGVRWVRDAPALRLLSRAAVLLLLKHPQPSVAYRQLAQLAGFRKVRLDVPGATRRAAAKSLAARVDRGMRLLFASRVPLRSVTVLATVAALLNVVYSVYVVAVFILKEDVAPGWTTLSLQTSGMFLLVSLILLVLGEYVLQLATALKGGAPWHVARELKSVRVSRRRDLNVVDVAGRGRGEA